MDDPEKLRLLKKEFKGNLYEMKSPKPFVETLKEFQSAIKNDNQNEQNVKRYDCPNCQGCGCTTCGGFGYLEY